MLTLLAAIILSVTPALMAQEWRWISPSPSGYSIHDMELVSQDLIILAGGNGSVLISCDGGNAWDFRQRIAGNSKSLRRLAFSNDNIWVCDEDGAVFTSADLGLNWLDVSNRFSEGVAEIEFSDQLSGVAVSETGTVFRTTDGGLLWDVTTLPFSRPAANVEVVFSSQNTGWVLATYFDSFIYGDLYKTIDGGITWQHQHTVDQLCQTNNNLTAGSEDVLAYRCGNKLMLSQDGGSSFSEISYPQINFSLLSAIELETGSKIWAGFSKGQIFFSEDAGTTWQMALELDETERIAGFDVSVDGGIALRSSNSQIFARQGSDSTWIQQSTSSIKRDIKGVSFANNVGYACSDSGLIYKSYDRGNTWFTIDTGHAGGIVTIEAVTEDVVICGVFKGVLRSLDGGDTWELIQFGDSGSTLDVDFPTANVGYLILQNIVYKSTDVGQTWNFLIEFPLGGSLTNLAFVDENTGIAGGSWMPAYRTQDGGQSWQQAIEWTDIQGITFVDHEVGWAVGTSGRLYKTNDGGANWARLNGFTLGKLLDVAFTDRQNGWIIESRKIWRTTDAGATWQIEIALGRGLTNLVVSSSQFQELIAGGYDGGLLKFDSMTSTSFCSNDIGEINSAELPKRFELLPNYPNPFNPTTTIRYTLNNTQRVTLAIYNLQGQKVRTLINHTQQAGEQQAVWDGFNDSGEAVGSGVYFYRLTADGFSESRKMVLLR